MVSQKNIISSNPSPFLCNRRITKMDKLTGSRVQFMSDHPEFGDLYSLDIYADEIQDGKLN